MATIGPTREHGRALAKLASESTVRRLLLAVGFGAFALGARFRASLLWVAVLAIALLRHRGCAARPGLP